MLNSDGTSITNNEASKTSKLIDPLVQAAKKVPNAFDIPTAGQKASTVAQTGGTQAT